MSSPGRTMNVLPFLSATISLPSFVLYLNIKYWSCSRYPLQENPDVSSTTMVNAVLSFHEGRSNVHNLTVSPIWSPAMSPVMVKFDFCVVHVTVIAATAGSTMAAMPLDSLISVRF